MGTGDALYQGWHAFGKLVFGWINVDQVIQVARPGNAACPRRGGTCSTEGGTFTLQAQDTPGPHDGVSKVALIIYGTNPKSMDRPENYFVIEYNAGYNPRLDFSRGATLYYAALYPKSSGATHMYGDTANMDAWPTSPLSAHQKSIITLLKDSLLF
jgi:hypothetical protein